MTKVTARLKPHPDLSTAWPTPGVFYPGVWTFSVAFAAQPPQQTRAHHLLPDLASGEDKNPAALISYGWSFVYSVLGEGSLQKGQKALEVFTRREKRKKENVFRKKNRDNII